jgi:exopolysaccharide production protein ExoQ
MFPIIYALSFITVTGLLVEQAFGSTMLILAFAGWLAYGAQKPGRVMVAFAKSNVVIWLMPAIAMLSVLWSQEPSISFRAAVETFITVGMAVLVARNVPPRNLIAIFFVALALICLASVPINHQSYDFLAERSNDTGIYENKNTFSTVSALLVITGLIVLVDRRMPSWVRWTTVPLIVLGLIQNLQSHSVASTLALGLAIAWGAPIMAAALFPTKMRKFYVTLIVVGGVVLLGLGSVVTVAFHEELLALVGKDVTLTGRTELWFYAAKFISTNSILGVGYDAFWVPGHQMAEFLWRLEHEQSGAGFSFHNLYYEIAVELGAPGVIAGAVVILMTFLCSVQWLRLDTSCDSIFFFSTVVFTLIIQIQGYDLFATFDPLYWVFSAAFLYSRNWNKWRAVEKPRRRQLVRLPSPLVGPTTI